jgi:hypothetical protein
MESGREVLWSAHDRADASAVAHAANVVSVVRLRASSHTTMLLAVQSLHVYRADFVEVDDAPYAVSSPGEFPWMCHVVDAATQE